MTDDYESLIQNVSGVFDDAKDIAANISSWFSDTEEAFSAYREAGIRYDKNAPDFEQRIEKINLSNDTNILPSLSDISDKYSFSDTMRSIFDAAPDIINYVTPPDFTEIFDLELQAVNLPIVKRLLQNRLAKTAVSAIKTGISSIGRKEAAKIYSESDNDIVKSEVIKQLASETSDVRIDEITKLRDSIELQDQLKFDSYLPTNSDIKYDPNELLRFVHEDFAANFRILQKEYETQRNIADPKEKVEIPKLYSRRYFEESFGRKLPERIEKHIARFDQFGFLESILGDAPIAGSDIEKAGQELIRLEALPDKTPEIKENIKNAKSTLNNSLKNVIKMYESYGVSVVDDARVSYALYRGEAFLKKEAKFFDAKYAGYGDLVTDLYKGNSNFLNHITKNVNTKDLAAIHGNYYTNPNLAKSKVIADIISVTNEVNTEKRINDMIKIGTTKPQEFIKRFGDFIDSEKYNASEIKMRYEKELDEDIAEFRDSSGLISFSSSEIQDFYSSLTGTLSSSRRSNKLTAMLRKYEKQLDEPLVKAGVDIKRIENWHPSLWNPDKFNDSGKELFIELGMELFDWDRIRQGVYVPKDGEEDFLIKVAETIASSGNIFITGNGQYSGAKKTVSNSMRGSKIIFFKDGAAYYRMMNLFGQTVDPLQFVLEYINRMIGTISSATYYGGSKYRFFNTKVPAILREYHGKVSATNYEIMDQTIKDMQVLNDGRSDFSFPIGYKFFNELYGARITSMVGSAALTVFFGDAVATMGAAMRMGESNKQAIQIALKSMNLWNNKIFKSSLKEIFNNENGTKLAAADAMFIIDRQSRFIDERIRNNTSKLGKFNTFIRKVAMTEAVSASMSYAYQEQQCLTLGRMASLEFTDLPDILQQELKNVGLTVKEWDELVKHVTLVPSGDGYVPYVNPRYISRHASEDIQYRLGRKLSDYINNNMQAANPSQDTYGRLKSFEASIIRLEKAGKYPQAAATRTLNLFWTITASASRFMLESIKSAANDGNMSGVALLIFYALVTGLSREILGDILNGKKTDMTNPETYLRAMEFSSLLSPGQEFLGEVIMKLLASSRGNFDAQMINSGNKSIIDELAYSSYIAAGSYSDDPEKAQRARAKTLKNINDMFNPLRRFPIIGLVTDRMVVSPIRHAIDPNSKRQDAINVKNMSTRGINYWWDPGTNYPGENVSTKKGKKNVQARSKTERQEKAAIQAALDQ